MQLSLPPVCLLYSCTRQNTELPTLRLGLFLLVAPSNYSPPRLASRGAPISTTKLSAVLILMMPMTRSFLAGRYWMGNLASVFT